MRETISNNSKVNPNSVFWVLTIPAIWSDSARQFMREAAAEAGIPRDRIRLVREPEAAAIFWKKGMQTSGNLNIKKLSVGNKYIIADLGGGLVDICVHEILPDDRFRELHKATGNDLGGNSVDNMFIQFLMKVVSDKVWKIFFRQQYFDFVKLMRSFEEFKRKFDTKTEKIVIELPASLIKLAEQNARSTFSDIVKAVEEHEYVTVVDETKLHLKKEIVESFFKPSVDGIVSMLTDILKECSNTEINNLILAGGYSASPYVTEFIKMEMARMDVTHVREQELAVLKGAVLMGFEPTDIIERRARYTYGFAIARPFEEKIHPRKLKFYRDGKVLCRDIYHKVIDKNQLLKVGDTFKVETRNNDRKFFKFKQREACAQLFRSTKDDPKYCTKEDGCTEVFSSKIEAPERGWSERLCTDYVLVVGDTDFEVLAFDIFSGRKYTTRKEIL
ncbi:heat shock 70 kDa protein 12A-like [Mercenaria mercenaria]|uniref:heat shock 70 kDa protein 12A-like n=1 Tax=Mercenaria mercenaria TaxID=6596 RepID=UPI00234F5B5C|nr:heat shock 70 kDa protein 12A-like [Mercenaria mercenaria]